MFFGRKPLASRSISRTIPATFAFKPTQLGFPGLAISLSDASNFGECAQLIHILTRPWATNFVFLSLIFRDS